jgi:methylaspartate mutase epsilon subunit
MQLPSWKQIIEYNKQHENMSVVNKLRSSIDWGIPLVQPRCGVGSIDGMVDLLKKIESFANPDLLTITIDSYTRLNNFETALRKLKDKPHDLNGFPLVSHGYLKCRKINSSITTPIQIRHGSPDCEQLFLHSIASGFSAFEGGGISYNIPYSKRCLLSTSLNAWEKIDAYCGLAAEQGVIIDRELFGTLTAVLVPPSLSLSISVLESILAARQGVRCLSVSFAETGNTLQDVATLRLIPRLIRGYIHFFLGESVAKKVEIYTVLHQFMGAFPKNKKAAIKLLKQGARVSKWGNANKIITKTAVEATCIPSTQDNIEGIRIVKDELKKVGDNPVPERDICKEQWWISKEVEEILSPIMEGSGDLKKNIILGFKQGSLDVPFAPSINALGKVFPVRDAKGAIRYGDAGNLRFSVEVLRRNQDLIGERGRIHWRTKLYEDIYYFSHTNKLKSKPGRIKKSFHPCLNQPIAVLFGTHSDAHAVGNYIADKILKENGYNVINLGVCTALEELSECLSNTVGVEVLVIGSNNGHCYEDLKGLKSILLHHRLDCPVILGGNLTIRDECIDDVLPRFSALGVTEVVESLDDLENKVAIIRSHLDVPIKNKYLIEKGEYATV